ncbi:MAG: tetratricopeptide repeat protein, partial [Lachnospiraceae bacterium]|nr:tetratricopeptide repeat protein [Lachnospiraceae bacterium]
MQTEEIINKLDRLFSENKGQEAQQLLDDSIRLAIGEADDNALLTLLNEMIGYMRETSQVESSYRYADAALKLMERMGIEGSMPYATTLLNIANAYRAGGRLAESMAYYEEVLELYQKNLAGNDMLFASLYNNVSLLYQEMDNFGKAKENLLKELPIVQVNEDT